MIKQIIQQAVNAKYALAQADDALINHVLNDAAAQLVLHTSDILDANHVDLQQMDPSNPKYDRLKLTKERINGIADDMKMVATLPSSVGKTLYENTRPNGMNIRKISVPFGVIGVVYEARPNVTLDVAALCIKAGNVAVLKGGTDATHSNIALAQIFGDALKNNELPEAVCTLLPPQRNATIALLDAIGLVDLVIPRGSKELIDFVRTNAKVPVIETGAGICHTYLDKDGDKHIAKDVVFNAKTRRVSVCNALDCLIVHQDKLKELPFVCQKLAEKQVLIYADTPSINALHSHYPTQLLKPADETRYGTEFLDYIMSVKTVHSIEDAIQHITKYGSKHSECIVSDNQQTIQRFEKQVDAACVYANVSTSFTDGAQFGFGAEIGISTQKLHARGPMALQELTTYKYLIEGSGQIRP